MIKGLGGLAAVLFVALLVSVAWGNSRWTGLTRELLQRLESARQPATPRDFDDSMLDGLPAPVQRYFRAAIAPGTPMIAVMRAHHIGSFNLSASAEQWKPFQSSQTATTGRPGFVWDGRISVFPGLTVNVHDAYIGGEGILNPAVAGLVSLTDLRGGGEIAQGELMRYLAEAAWYPSALLPGRGLSWRAIDERRAEATLVDGPLSVAMEFRFGEDQMIESVLVSARGRSVGGRFIPTPWEGRWSGYQLRSGYRVPMRGEVAWLTPEGRKPYWRGSVSSIEYDFVR